MLNEFKKIAEKTEILKEMLETEATNIPEGVIEDMEDEKWADLKQEQTEHLSTLLNRD